TIVHPTGNQHVVNMSDNGLAPDTVANDGIYSATYTGGDIPGDYWATAKAIGSLNGVGYVRTSQDVLRIAPSVAALVAVQSDAPTDLNSASGLYEGLAVNVAVSATEPLTVTLSA